MSFAPNRLKVQLRLAVTRLRLLQQKKSGQNNAARREVAQLLEKGKEESARIRVEHIIREDLNMEAMEILELHCELLLARFGLLEQMKNCDPAIAEAVNTIIYAAPRTEVKELSLARDQLIAKFGREFALAAMENRNEVVNSRIIQKLKVQTPDPILVDQYLKEIANAYNVAWNGSIGTDVDGTESIGLGTDDLPRVTAPRQEPTAFPAKGASGSQPTAGSGSLVAPEPRGKPANGFNTSDSAQGDATSAPAEPDFDELTRRFEKLKRRQ
ncbi:regulator of Vps4 activity in the MVB pathway-domain-containing protein [Hyaloraphidium curvatum]|nr:regulator of Vps4 activity in the MVB pathway-domain-containing protein [Hyaloraphidium curvatum]